MPSLPNPYGPATQVGDGLRAISNAIFNMGRAQSYGRYARQRSEAQEAEDMAQAELHRANVNKLQEETRGLEQARLASSPETVLELGAAISGLDRDTYTRALNAMRGAPLPAPTDPEAPAPVQVRPVDIDAARRGYIVGVRHQSDPKGNFNELMKALMTHQQTNDYVRAMSGQVPVDQFGDAVAAAEGKPRYNMESGIQYSTQRQGQTYMTPLGQAKIGSERQQQTLNREKIQSEKSLQGYRGAQADKLKLETTNLKTGKTAGTGAAAPEKRKPLSAGEVKVMDNHLADVVGTRFDKIDPQSRAAILSHAYQLAVDPGSEWHRNPMGAVEQAVADMAPEGFEDAAGMFSSARFVPKGGIRPAPTASSSEDVVVRPPQAASASPAQPSLPPQAVAKLREGVQTRFGNGQTWTLQNGIPVQVQ